MFQWPRRPDTPLLILFIAQGIISALSLRKDHISFITPVVEVWVGVVNAGYLFHSQQTIPPIKRCVVR